MELFDTVITDDAKDRVQECLDSGYISEGRLVKEFEHNLGREFGYRNCLAVNSCTSALHLVLYELEIGAGDEVIIPAQTFIATGIAVLMCGAKVVFADIDKDTGNISVEDVRKKINYNTRAVISVAWGGNPPNLLALSELCNHENVFLIQDNAQALGARYQGRPVTEYGDFSCFSFQATKHLTTGDGGLIVSRSKIDHDIIKSLRWFGIDRDADLPDETGERQYVLYNYGFKYQMNDYAAALGLGNLSGLRERMYIRQAVSHYYDGHLNSVGRTTKDGSVHWMYDILVERREDFIRVMRSRSIPVSVVHKGIHYHPLFESSDELPNQEYWDAHHVCLPCHSSMTWDDVGRVVDAVNLGW